jgi:XTP/dITP diphosphohydrolase
MTSKLDQLIETAHTLRNPGGCPWDAEQTHQTLTKYLLEETYELLDAIETNNREEIIEELGDVLYQVIFHTDLAQTGSLGEPFDIQDVAEVAMNKMKQRHPHVFGTPEELEKFKAETGDDVMLNWDNHKAKEKPHRNSILDGIPQALPALALADKVLGKAEKAGLIDKTDEHPIPIQDEADLGKLLLAIVHSARAKGLEPERALREATRELQVEIRAWELDPDNDAGVIGSSS